MKSKKALSAVVATVLIILITVAAVTIIWAAIIPMIKNKISGGSLCLDAVSQVSLVKDGGYTCYTKNSSGSVLNLSLQITHGAKDFDLSDIQVLVSSEGNTKTALLSNNSVVMIPSDATVPMPGINQEKVYVIDIFSSTGMNMDVTSLDKVQIAPIVKVGNTQETCDISSEAVLDMCA